MIFSIRLVRIAALAGCAAALAGCTLTPKGTREEESRADLAGQIYLLPYEQRETPDLPASPQWPDVLRRAFYANGDLEAAYHEWRAALARVEMASGWPNSNVNLGFDYMFSKERMKSWDRTTLSAGFDPAMNLQIPQKVMTAARGRLEEARAAGLRFEVKKFEVQRSVLTQWLDFSMMAEEVRLKEENLSLLRMMEENQAALLRAGGRQQDLLKSQVEYRLAENELATLRSRLDAMRAMLNGMLARPADAPLVPPAALPAPREVTDDDAALIASAVSANPELSALARDVAGRKDALELARLAYIPDITPQASITGSVSQMLGAMVTLPTNMVMVNGSVREARAMLAASQAMARQARSDKAGAFVAALYAMRNAQRQAHVVRETIGPKAQQMMQSSREAYSAGAVGFVEMLDSQRTLLEVRMMLAQARTEREKRLAEMEALAGVDVETLGRTPATTAPATTGPAATAPTTLPAMPSTGVHSHE